MISFDDVLRARDGLARRLHRTPVFSSQSLSALVGAPTFLKAELFQRTGSFKPRGILNKIASLSFAEKRRGVISISAGNAAQAVAYAARAEGADATVVMWQGASAQKIEATRGYGATVDLGSPGPTEAFAQLQRLIAETGKVLVHPFDDPLVIAGHGTLGSEIVEDVPELHTVVVPIGGGGLASGIALAVKVLRPDARVIGVEPETSTAMWSALAAGAPVPVTPVSIADGLNAPFAGEHTFPLCRELLDEIVLVSEEEIRVGMRFLYERAKLACEPVGAAATAALLAGKVPTVDSTSAVVSVVSGGNVATRTASAILGSDEGRHPS